VLLMATFVLGSVFLGIKAVEYYKEFLEHHVPGLSFQFEKEYFRQAQLFYLLYFVMTALHAVHMVIGMGVILAMVWMSWRGRFSRDYYTPLEVTGLYWHFVDVVWIFLFPLLYLIGRHGGT